MKNLNEKVVLVTGGASGLGRAIVERFHAERAKVIIADLNKERGQALADAFDTLYIHTEVTDPASVEAAIACTVKEFGRLDVMINNAGVASDPVPFHDSAIENWQKVIDVDLSGVFFGMKYAIAQFLNQGGCRGNIVNISSIAGIVGVPSSAPYCAAKAGVSNLTREGAIEYGRHGIRVNAVAPTAVDTELSRSAFPGLDNAAVDKFFGSMNPLVGAPSPADVAAAVAFLASDDARFVSGVILPVDGGFTAR